MKHFLAIYTGSPDSSNMKQWQSLDPAARKVREEKGMKEWTKWAEKNQKVIVVQGGPLGKTKRIDTKGVADIRNQMAAFVVVKAVSHDAAAELFINHPHFSVFPGDGVEIMECLPIPGQGV